MTDWAEEYVGETLNFDRLPRDHHKHLRSTNLPERVNEEIKRRTRVRTFPNPEQGGDEDRRPIHQAVGRGCLVPQLDGHHPVKPEVQTEGCSYDGIEGRWPPFG